MEFSIFEDYDKYILEYTVASKGISNGKYDMVIHKDSKFLLYSFNCYISQIYGSLQLIRHTNIADND